MRKSTVGLALVALGFMLFFGTRTEADGVSISLDTAYCFNGHFAPCDGGLAKVTNNGTDPIIVDRIVASGWSSGHTDDLTFENVSFPTLIPGGTSSVFNSFLTPFGDDTSNDGTVLNPSLGIIFTISVHDAVDFSTGTFTFFDNASSGYAFVGGAGTALNGLDCDNPPGQAGCNTFLADPSASFTNPVSSAVPEPGTLALFSSGLAGLAWARRRFARS